MARLVFDIEANGFLEDMDRVHCMVLKDCDTGEVFEHRPDTVALGARQLMDADLVIGHNIIGYDLLALEKVLPGFKVNLSNVVDTLVLSRLLWPNISDWDLAAGNNRKWNRVNGTSVGSHSLKAWGERLGCNKMEYTGTFDEFTEDMLEYNGVDTEVTFRLWNYIQEQGYSEQASKLEHVVTSVCARQEQYGYPFDRASAEALASSLQQEVHRLELELQDVFKPWVVTDGSVRRAPYPSDEKGWWGYHETSAVPVVIKGEPQYYKKTGELKMKEKKTFFGYKHQPIKIVEFNPGSRHHIADRLIKLRGWKPKAYTDSGQPKIDEKVLNALVWPEAKLLARYFLVKKVLGYIVGQDHDKGWLNVEKKGRVHGSIIVNGAITGRGTHKVIANIPRVSSPFGKELRALFTASPGRVQVGADMSGIELRVFAHYLSRYDGGELGKIVCEGDVHWNNVRLLGLTDENYDEDNPTHVLYRDGLKTFIYAFLYGAGPMKIGSIILENIVTPLRNAGLVYQPFVDRFFDGNPNPGEKLLTRAGREAKEQFLERTPGLEELTTAVSKAAKRGYLVGLDGRKVWVRKEHAALNTLLQSAGAILSKAWIMCVDEEIKRREWQSKCQQLIWYHDELQYDSDPSIAPELGQVLVSTIATAGTLANMRVPLKGKYKIGHNWKECH